MGTLTQLKNEWMYEFHMAFVQPNPFQDLYRIMFAITDGTLTGIKEFEATDYMNEVECFSLVDSCIESGMGD